MLITTTVKFHLQIVYYNITVELHIFKFLLLLKNSILKFKLLNPFASGIQKVLLSPITGLFSVKIGKKILAIKNFSVNDTMSGQPNKRLIH